MNPTQLKESIIHVLERGLVPMVAGSPGIGKSDIIRAVAKYLDVKVIDMRLSQCDPTDMLGFPTHNGARMGYAPPEHFPLKGMDKLPFKEDGVTRYKGWLLFLDEFTTAPLSVQAAAYKLVLDREVGIYELHPRCVTVCAGNLATDAAIVNRMSTAMQSRLVHLESHPDIRSWLEWAATSGIDHRVASYLEGHPSHLHQFKPDHNDKTFACPRTWEFTSKLIKDVIDFPAYMLDLLIGTLSAGIANEFNAYIKYCADLPTISDIIARPDDIGIPEDPALLFAVSHMVGAYLEAPDADRLMRFVERLPTEFSTVCLRTAIKRKKELLKLPPVRKWAHELGAEMFQ